MVIEYNGIFHYHILNGKTSNYTLSKQQMNDMIKDDYCKKNNIPILWIPYWINDKEVKESIQQFVTKYLRNKV